MIPKPTWRLRHQLVLLAAVALLPVAVVGAWSIKTLVEERRHEAERSVLELSRAMASAVDAELDSAISSLRALSYSSALAEGDIRAFYDIAREAVTADPSWVGIVLTDAEGRLIFKTAFPFGVDGGRVVDPESVQRAIETRAPAVGQLAKGQVAGYAFPVRVPVFRDGELAYVLTAAVRPDRILKIVQRQNVPRNWVISVFDAGANRVARSKDHDATLGTRPQPSLAGLMSGAKLEGTGIASALEGDETITGFTRLPQFGWTVAIGTPTSDIKSAIVGTVAWYTTALLASLAVFVVLAILVSRRIVAGIGVLQEQALRLGEGSPVEPVTSRIRELNEMNDALVAASAERQKVEAERKALLGSLQEALARAEEAGSAKDQFLAMLGHELRNPLGPIVAALHLMELRGDPAGAREREIMARQVDHMRRLVDDLLDISRIVRGTLVMKSEPVNVNTVLERALEAVQPSVGGRRSGILVKPSEVSPWVSGDATRLVQAVTNLLVNALRFDPGGAVSVAAEARGAQVWITVSDQGAGMTSETLERVFDAFYQAPQSLARSSGGLGLGLAIVRSIVEAHGGKVSAASEGLGRGSRFQIVLPAIQAPAPELADPSTHSGRRTGKVLLVDDNLDAAEAVGAALAFAGHDLRVAHSANGALESMAQALPDVAILDIGLPGMDGFQLALAMRARHPSWSGRLIALTGYGQAADKAKAAAAGFDVHLTKPTPIDELLVALDSLLAPLSTLGDAAGH